MKKEFAIIFCLIFIISLGSASIYLEKNPSEIYNLGDQIELTLIISPETDFNEAVSVYLECLNKETEIYKQFISTNTETRRQIIIPLIKSFVGDSLGECKISYEISNKRESISSNFKISDKINLKINSKTDINPGEEFKISGSAIKENNQKANGIIEIIFPFEEEIIHSAEIKEGEFELKITLPENTKAGYKNIQLEAYETDKNLLKTNKGSQPSQIFINQIPKNLEINLEKNKIFPGESLQGRIILRDQTGEKMDSYAYIAIKDEKNEIIEKIEKSTGLDFLFKTEYYTPANIWTISAYSQELISTTQFEILEKKAIETSIINSTLIVRNIGNTIYKESLEIKIGESIKKINLNLPVKGEQKYKLSAPNGEYEIELEGNIQKTFLTGNSIRIKEEGKLNLNPISIISWAFVIIVLIFFCILIFRKNRKKSFFARMIKGKNTSKKVQPEIIAKSESPSISENVELTLSITGVKQDSSIGCISLKNYEEIKSGKGFVKENLEYIKKIVEQSKGFLYQNKQSIFFIYSPAITKTFKNELTAVKIARNIKEYLDEHNRKFKQKIDFGIGVGKGALIVNPERGNIKFMSMGSVLINVKKMSNSSQGEILISEEIKNPLMNSIRSELKGEYYMLKEIKEEKKDHSKFITGFIERQKKELNKK